MPFFVFCSWMLKFAYKNTRAADDVLRDSKFNVVFGILELNK
jgi:hypothetical protein